MNSDIPNFIRRIPFLGSRWVNQQQQQKRQALKARFFDEQFYLYSNKDLLTSGEDPWEHFCQIGSKQNRRPNLIFSPNFYQTIYPDLAQANIPPVEHYLDYGFYENRLCTEAFYPAYYFSQRYPGEAPGFERLLSDYYSGLLFEDPPLVCHLYPTDFKIARILRAVLALTNDGSVDRLAFNTSDQPEISVIIPVYNQITYTLNCLAALALYPPKVSWEIIVIDDCSTDKTSELLSQIKGLRYIRNEQNLGFLQNCNKAASLARGKKLVFLNNDTCPLPGWIDSLLKTFQLYPEAGLVGAKLVYPDGRLQEAGGLIWGDGSGTNCGKFQNPDHPHYNYVREVDFCSGAGIMIPADLWQDIGGFDARFTPAYYEDADLAFAVQSKNRQVLYQPHSEIIHFEGVSCGTDVTQGVKSYQTVNQQKFTEKWSQILATRSNEIEHSKLAVQEKKLKALVIDQQVPTPDRDAGSVYCFNFLKILRNKYQIDFLDSQSVNHAGRYTQDLQDLGVCHLYGPWFRRDLFQDLPLDWKSLDLVVLFRHNVVSEFIDKIRDLAPQAKIIFMTVDLHYHRLEQEAKILGTKKAFEVAKKTKGEELAGMLKSDVTVVLGAGETAIIKEQLPFVNCCQLPLWQTVATSVKPFVQRKDIFFLGGFNHPPNSDALTYFLEQIWPLASKKLPGVCFYIFGNTIPEKFQKFITDNVKIGGYVEDLADVFDHFRVNIAPLRYGAGQNGKVISSLCWGLPTVISKLAADGIGIKHDVETLVSDQPEEFANLIVKLYQDQELWERLSDNSLKFAQQFLSEAMAEKVIDSILQDLSSR